MFKFAVAVSTATLLTAGYAGSISRAESSTPPGPQRVEEAGPGPADRTFATLVRAFQESKWKFDPVDGKRAIRTSFNERNGPYRCIAGVHGDRPAVWFWSIAAFRVPEEKRTAMAEFLTRANFGLMIGNFEMDYRDGEVRFKTSVAVPNGELTTEMAKTMVVTNLGAMDRYLPGMTSVIWGDVSPEVAVNKIEGRSSGPAPQPTRHESSPLAIGR